MKTKTIFLIAAVAATFMCCFNAEAKIWRVNNQSIFDPDFTNLQTAINSASPQDTIHVEASGTDYGSIHITFPVVIIGPGYFLDKNTELQKNPTPSTINEIYFDAGAAGTVITGIRVANSLYINEGNVTIERCYVETTIWFMNHTPNVLNNIIIKQCYVNGSTAMVHNVSATAYDGGPVNNLIISNCYFGKDLNLCGSLGGLVNNYQGVVSNCVFNKNVNAWSLNLTFQNNIIKGTFIENNNSKDNVKYNLFIAAAIPAWLSVAGNTNVFKSSNVFITATSSLDYSLHLNPILAQCPECYQGLAGTEMGVYGGNDKYVLSGVPDVPAIYMLNAPVQTIQGGNINVNISTKSNN